jgi:hypothetical protein
MRLYVLKGYVGRKKVKEPKTGEEGVPNTKTT